MKLDELSEELRAKVKTCQTPEEMFAIAKEEGYELSDEQLNSIAGGGFWDSCSDDCTSDCSSKGICWGAGG